MISNFVSQKFRFWAFVSMVLLVFVHGYNLHERYLQPWSVVDEPLTLTSFTEYFLANGIFRFRIPMLFVISGYLFALNDFKPTKERIRSRFNTLLIPYFIWSAVGILLSFTLELFPYTRQLIAGSHVLQIDQSRMLIHDYHWYEIIARWVFFPVAYQLWFIRVLFIYNLAYPVITWCVLNRKAKWVFFSIVTLLWLTTFGTPLLEGEGLLFFSLGVLFQKKNFNLEESNTTVNAYWVTLAFVLVAAGKTFLAFRGYALIGNAVYPTITFLHKAVIALGLLSAWYASNGLVKWFMARRWFIWLSYFSFIIYALHAPIVAFAIDGMFQWLQPFQYYRALTFMLLPLLVIAVCVIVGATLRRLTPSLYAILTGSRGI